MNRIPGEILGLRPGDRVRVKGPEAILSTLDESGCVDKMPFMPEMLNACGAVFTVYARADKTCDTATRTGGRELSDTVHLQGQRCDGSAHGGCQAACLNFWKEAWLEPVPDEDSSSRTERFSDESIESARSRVSRYATEDSESGDTPVYSCQATRLPEFTKPLKPTALRQYWRDVTTNNVSPLRMIRVAFLSLYARIVGLGIGYSFWVSLYDAVQRLRNRPPWPHKTGTLSATPTEILGLEIGEYVRVKSFEEILSTLDKNNKNRGLSFDAEMVRFCGSIHRVHSRVDKIINEASGEMMHFVNPCIILEDVWCSSDWSECRRFCPRSIYHYWREIWLERVPAPASPKTP